VIERETQTNMSPLMDLRRVWQDKPAIKKDRRIYQAGGATLALGTYRDGALRKVVGGAGLRRDGSEDVAAGAADAAPEVPPPRPPPL
jgi:hypothetical protein